MLKDDKQELLDILANDDTKEKLAGAKCFIKELELQLQKKDTQISSLGRQLVDAAAVAKLQHQKIAEMEEIIQLDANAKQDAVKEMAQVEGRMAALATKYEEQKVVIVEERERARETPLREAKLEAKLAEMEVRVKGLLQHVVEDQNRQRQEAKMEKVVSEAAQEPDTLRMRSLVETGSPDTVDRLGRAKTSAPAIPLPDLGTGGGWARDVSEMRAAVTEERLLAQAEAVGWSKQMLGFKLAEANSQRQEEASVQEALNQAAAQATFAKKVLGDKVVAAERQIRSEGNILGWSTRMIDAKIIEAEEHIFAEEMVQETLKRKVGGNTSQIARPAEAKPATGPFRLRNGYKVQFESVAHGDGTCLQANMTDGGMCSFGNSTDVCWTIHLEGVEENDHRIVQPGDTVTLSLADGNAFHSNSESGSGVSIGDWRWDLAWTIEGEESELWIGSVVNLRSTTGEGRYLLSDAEHGGPVSYGPSSYALGWKLAPHGDYSAEPDTGDCGLTAAGLSSKMLAAEEKLRAERVKNGMSSMNWSSRVLEMRTVGEAMAATSQRQRFSPPHLGSEILLADKIAEAKMRVEEHAKLLGWSPERIEAKLNESENRIHSAYESASAGTKCDTNRRDSYLL